MKPIKYPSTKHLPFSLTVHRDDSYFPNPEVFIDKEVIITEKLDGGNCQIINGGVYARSISEPTRCKSFDCIKNNILHRLQEYKYYRFYGENVYAIHSIIYNSLNSYYYIFAIMDGDIFLSWRAIEEISKNVNIPTVPVLYKGVFKNIKEIETWMKDRIKHPSIFNGNCEGFVIRVSRGFHIDEFKTSIAKFVRPNHVQTDIHWSKSWKPQNIIMI